MNIPDKVLGFHNEDYWKKYFDKLKELNSQKSMFAKYTEHIKEIERKNKKAEGKRRKSDGVLVTGATTKNEIRRLRRILLQKISEVISEQDDKECKQIKVQGLQMKVEALDRILSQIEKAEREERKTKMRKSKRGQTEAVYLTKEDLNVKKKDTLGIDVAEPLCDFVSVSPLVDLAAVFESAINAVTTAQTAPVQAASQDTQNIDVQA